MTFRTYLGVFAWVVFFAVMVGGCTMTMLQDAKRSDACHARGGVWIYRQQVCVQPWQSGK